MKNERQAAMRMGKFNTETRLKRMWRKSMRTGFRFLASSDSKLSANCEHGNYMHSYANPHVLGNHTYTQHETDEWSAPNYGIKLNWF